MKTSLLEAISPTARTLLERNLAKISQSEPKFNFRAEMTKARSRFQHFHRETPANETQSLHLLALSSAELISTFSFDESDPLVIKAKIRELTYIASLCEMWAEQLEAEQIL